MIEICTSSKISKINSRAEKKIFIYLRTQVYFCQTTFQIQFSRKRKFTVENFYFIFSIYFFLLFFSFFFHPEWTFPRNVSIIRSFHRKFCVQRNWTTRCCIVFAINSSVDLRHVEMVTWLMFKVQTNVRGEGVGPRHVWVCVGIHYTCLRC